ncbi:ABC transporter ATP-binding protein [Desulfuribacillus alkaliarsenatis]|uniref:Nitrate/sulfonate/bicarbonate ABC transporter ATP-binding protein n=1 Tax=Desulfuribacillus alkaliarsenatis TaxID=766136 RepID=A0A1E5G551_9FIRM|nr:ABC transporter ATP-binding protein [Desulfuribacillus alkaliarsenatis]OEF98249.1 nitrate/sulfonate/bicarbonate ABC transporter ATP-binding protein [Desulfuribacillus alkaliarsenatis]
MLTIKKVYKSFPGEKTDNLVLDGIDLEIKTGEFVALLGPSGCGKTTLMNIVAGLEQASSGTVTLHGKEVTKPGPDRGVIFQESGLFPWMTVEQNVAFPMKQQSRFSKEYIKNSVDRYLRMVHLHKYRDALPHQLSGGMKQRTAIARTFAMEPEVLLMDEPFAALDEQTRMMLHYQLGKIWQESKKTIIFVTHNIREALILADRIIVMATQPGKIKKEFIIEESRPRDFQNDILHYHEKQIFDALGEEIDKVMKQEMGESIYAQKNRIHGDSDSYMGGAI